MAANGEDPPTYGRYRPPVSPATRPPAPYADSGDFMPRNTYLNSAVVQTIDVRTTPNSNAALIGDRQAREAYWAAQLRYNMENWRRGQIGVIQIDRDRRLWGLNLRCNTDWETMRANPTPPAISMIWDADLGEFALYCSQSGNGHFVLDGDTA